MFDTCAVIVTYADRWNFLAQSIESAFVAGVSKVVVVDNGSGAQTQDGLAAAAVRFEGRLHLVRNEVNRGSAGGFKVGIETALRCSDASHVWLLDDDNVPDVNALKKLCLAVNLLDGAGDVILASYRPPLMAYLVKLAAGGRLAMRNNSFLGFHLADAFYKVKLRIFSRGATAPIVAPILPLQISIYGGLFLHRDWVGRVGLPDERLFVYSDDTEYTKRLIDAGASIYLVTSSLINDVELSWYNDSRAGHRWMDPRANPQKVYLMVRNKAFVGRKWIKSLLFYRLNKYFLVCSLFVHSMIFEKNKSHMMRRFKLVLNAVRDGEKGDLSRNTL